MIPSLSLSSTDQLTANTKGTGGSSGTAGGSRGIVKQIVFPGGKATATADGGSLPWWGWLAIGGGVLGVFWMATRR